MELYSTLLDSTRLDLTSIIAQAHNAESSKKDSGSPAPGVAKKRRHGPTEHTEIYPNQSVGFGNVDATDELYARFVVLATNPEFTFTTDQQNGVNLGNNTCNNSI